MQHFSVGPRKGRRGGGFENYYFKFVFLFLSNVTDDGSQSLAVVSRSKLLWNWIFDLKDKIREEVKIIEQFE